jgi:hypothetical protein
MEANHDLKFNRILVKLSGEALMGEDAYGVNRVTIDRIVSELVEVAQLGVQMASRYRRWKYLSRYGTCGIWDG